MRTRCGLRPPTQRQSVNRRAGLVQPGVIRLLLQLVRPGLACSLLILCSGLNEKAYGYSEGIEPVVERQTALLCREPTRLHEQRLAMPVLRVLVKKSVILLDDPGRDDEAAGSRAPTCHKASPLYVGYVGPLRS